MSIVAAIILCICIADAPTPPALWQNPAYWQRLSAGQTPDHVRRFLGDPVAEEESATRWVWYYQTPPETDAQGRPVRPVRGLVVFGRTPDGWSIQRFSEPNWSLVDGWGALQDRYNDEMRAYRRSQSPPPQTVYYRPPASRQAATAPVSPPQNRSLLPSSDHPPAAIPPAAADERMQAHMRYWLTAAGVFILMAFLFALSKGCKFFC